MPLEKYRDKRRFDQTPEPAPGAKAKSSAGARRRPRARFVVQEHHASSLHWDFRLERDGVLVSWAVPKGIPPDPRRNHLAVRVEDHPLEYIDFEGVIPEGNYGAGKVTVWDHGSYTEEKWSDQEVKVVLDGQRVKGRHVLFCTGGKNWMIHRMDPPQDAGRVELPTRIDPMLAKLSAAIPVSAREWAFEYKWDGIRALAFIEGGRLRLQSRRFEDITRRYPDLRPMAAALGSRQVVLDGEIVAIEPGGRPSFELLQQRMGLNGEVEIRRAMKAVPVAYLAFDLLHLDGRDCTRDSYLQRRSALEGLAFAGPLWRVPPHRLGDGEELLAESSRAGLEGVMAKRPDSVYETGRRTGAWLKIKNHLRQEFVIGGHLPGEGARDGRIGALLVGYMEAGHLRYAGKVGTGFNARTLGDLEALLAPLRQEASPFEGGPKPPKGSVFARPELVGEVEFTEWTTGGQLRHPSFKGLRTDKKAADVVREG